MHPIVINRDQNFYALVNFNQLLILNYLNYRFLPIFRDKMSWSASPLRNKIIVALIKRGGEIIDDDLARLVQRGEESISSDTLQRELMCLEIQGVVNISQITKTRKKIKLINQERLNPDLFK